MPFLIDLFTGSSKWLYIALVVLGVGFAGMTALSVNLYADKAALHVINETQAKSITEQAGKIKDLQDTLVEKRGLIEAQNARLKQMEVDRKSGEEKAQKEIEVINAKHEALRQSLNLKVDENANANDVKQFVNGFDWVR